MVYIDTKLATRKEDKKEGCGTVYAVDLTSLKDVLFYVQWTSWRRRRHPTILVPFPRMKATLKHERQTPLLLARAHTNTGDPTWPLSLLACAQKIFS